MYLTSLRPNWRHLHGLKNSTFIHFNLQALGLNYYIPYDFTRSFNHLPPDNYVSNNDPVTRSRRYANIKVDVTDNYKYSLSYTKNDIFQQKVDDNRVVKRQFELINHYKLLRLFIKLLQSYYYSMLLIFFQFQYPVWLKFYFSGSGNCRQIGAKSLQWCL